MTWYYICPSCGKKKSQYSLEIGFYEIKHLMGDMTFEEYLKGYEDYFLCSCGFIGAPIKEWVRE